MIDDGLNFAGDDKRDTGEELLPTARIAKELRLQQSVVQWVLRELEDRAR